MLFNSNGNLNKMAIELSFNKQIINIANGENYMKTLIPIANQRIAKLQTHGFLQWMNGSFGQYEDKFSFVPSMCFYILGLQDIYTIFSEKLAENATEQYLINYCKLNENSSDAYLEDLERLGFTSTSWGGPLRSIFSKTWSKENQSSRKYIYQIHNYIQYNNTDENIFTLGIIHDQLFLLMNAIANMSTSQPISSQLQFFNHEEEAVWPKGHLNIKELVDEELPGQSYYRCYEILDNLDKIFSEMLDEWFETKDHFKRNILLSECQFMTEQPDANGILH